MKVRRETEPVRVPEQVVMYLSLDEADRLRRFLQWAIEGAEHAAYSDLWELYRRVKEAVVGPYGEQICQNP